MPWRTDIWLRSQSSGRPIYKNNQWDCCVGGNSSQEWKWYEDCNGDIGCAHNDPTKWSPCKLISSTKETLVEDNFRDQQERNDLGGHFEDHWMFWSTGCKCLMASKGLKWGRCFGTAGGSDGSSLQLSVTRRPAPSTARGSEPFLPH